MATAALQPTSTDLTGTSDGNFLPPARRQQPAVICGVLAYYLLAGGPVVLVQAAVNGTLFSAYGAFSLFVLALIFKLGVQLSPIFIYGSRRHGLLHPLILMLCIWPMIASLPLIEGNLVPLIETLAGLPARVPEFLGSDTRSESEVFLVIAQLQAWEGVGYLMIIGVFSACERYFHKKPVVAEPAPKFAPERLKLLILLAVAASTVGVLAFVQSRGGITAHLGSLAQGRFLALESAGVVSVVGKFGLLAVYVWVCFDPRVVRTPWFIASLLLMAVMVFLYAGARGDFMIAIIGAAFCWTIRTGRFPIKLALLSFPILMVLYGTLLVLRQGSSADERAGLSVYDRLTMTDVSSFYETGSDEAAVRLSIRGAAPVMLEGYEASGGPLLGSSYAAITTWFIPRALWPDKPRGVGSLYAQLFTGADKQGNTIPIGLVAEAYWNFWYPGIFLIYGLTGLITFWAYHFYLRFGANPFVATAFVRFMSDFQLTAQAVVPFFHILLSLAVLWGLARLFAQEQTGLPKRAPRRGSTFSIR